MRGRPLLPDKRRRRVVELLRSRGSVSVAELETRFGISPRTAWRDLAQLERLGLVRRTRGGAVLPALSGHEDSFATRLEADVVAKERLAEASGERLARSSDRKRCAAAERTSPTTPCSRCAASPMAAT